MRDSYVTQGGIKVVRVKEAVGIGEALACWDW